TGNGLPTPLSATLTINNSAGVTLSQATTVNGTLTLTSGNITTNANTLSIGSGGTVTHTSGHVIGNLQRTFAAASNLRFDVGTANGYSPVDVNSASTGSFTVSATQGSYPNTATGLPTNRLARWWGLTNGGITSADVTFNYLAGDIT